MTAVAETLMLTTKCSAGCSHCPFSDPGMPALYLSRERMNAALRSGRPGLMVIAGGEPFEHPEIALILDDLCTHQTAFRIATGGHVDLRTWEKDLKRLASAGGGFQGISLGTDPLTPRCASSALAEQWRRNLRWLESARLPYSITVTLGDKLPPSFLGMLGDELRGTSPEFIFLRHPALLGEEAGRWGAKLRDITRAPLIFDVMEPH